MDPSELPGPLCVQAGFKSKQQLQLVTMKQALMGRADYERIKKRRCNENLAATSQLLPVNF